MDEIRAKQLHDEILAKTAEYYSLVHKSQQDAPFEAGKSKVNYAGRVFVPFQAIHESSGHFHFIF